MALKIGKALILIVRVLSRKTNGTLATLLWPPGLLTGFSDPLDTFSQKME